MRIANNLMALSTNNFLGINNKKNEKIIGKLSSGYRINRASDDAAGLSISEKMRAQIRGLSQASQNAQDGISLIQTAEGALSETHNMLQRIHELSVQASNGTYDDKDKSIIQNEINDLVNEIDFTSTSTEFNGMKLLDGTFADKSTNDSSLANGSQSMTLEDLLKHPSKNLNLIYMNQTNDFETVQSSAGTATISGYTDLKNVLQKEIVPQAVTSVLNAFSPAFNYLSSSSIGIGLNLYSDSSSSTLAAVSLGYYTNGSSVNSSMLNYQLSVNMASLSYDGSGKLTETSRTALETTIEHEMVHAFMDDALTNGMIGVSNGVKDSSNSFPSWFVEGMAQTAAGGYANCNDWVNSGLGITTGTSQSSIASRVTNSSYNLNSDTTASRYGTGYLACMYLGYLASGSTNITAGDISNGLGKILSDLIGGKSLDASINERTGGKYTSAADFANKFGDTASSSFIYNLTQLVGNTGNGGLATGNLLDSDLLPNVPKTVSLFQLDTTNDTVKNIYPSDVNVLSGGGKSSAGTAPVGDYTSTIGGGPGPIINPGSTIDLSNISPVSGVSYNSDLKVLTITDSGDYTLTGINTSGARVVVANGVNANITLNNSKLNTSTGAGISLEGSANVTLNLVGNNSVLTSKQGAAGIRVTTGATLTIQGSGTLDAESTFIPVAYIGNGAGIGGGENEDGGNIIINSGNITAICKSRSGAGIGGGENGDAGNITITGGNIVADGVAGIGGGNFGSGGNISISGGSVNAKGFLGAGIGGGYRNAGGTISISGGTISAESTNDGAGIGGGDGAINSSGGSITISGGTISAKSAGSGAGIGGGIGASAGTIILTGGTITAESGGSGAGIGCGLDSGGGSITINGAGVIVKATGDSHASNIGAGANYTGSPLDEVSVTKTRGIIFEGSSGSVYGNITLGRSLDCDGKTLTVRPDSTLTVSSSGRIFNHGTFTDSGRIENHGAIGSVTGTGITHHYVSSIAKHIKDPTTVTIGKSLADSIAAFSPSSITVAYNGTTRTLTGKWSVTDKDGNPINDLSGTIVGKNDQYKMTLTFSSEDNIYFDPSNMSIYEMIGSNTEPSYETISNEYVSASGPGGGGNTLTYSYTVNSAPASVAPPNPNPNPSSSDTKGGIHIQLGANRGQSIAITIESIRSHDLGIDKLSVLSHDDADNAMTVSKKAIDKVSEIRSSLGAYQNRLEHAIANIDNTGENLQDAESRIRDMNMADGIVEHSRCQILLQVEQSMLAQENQLPKNVLTLLS